MTEPIFEKSLYVGCGLTDAPKTFRDDVTRLKQTLRQDHSINVLDFLGLEAGTSMDVYDWDINHCVSRCSGFLAILDHPSTGLGRELGVAIARWIPVIGAVHETSKISRLPKGDLRTHGFPLVEYEDMVRELPALVVRQFVELYKVL